MTSIPDAATLLQAAAQYLERELLPTLEGYHRFQTRVSINALRTAERELRLAAVQRDAERERLVRLLGHDGSIGALDLELADAIRDGRLPLDTPGLAEHLRATLREALTINNPKWIDPDEPA
jgi:outer membrane protein TolC